MKMNLLERMVMNSPMRIRFLKKVEAPLLHQLAGSLEGMRVLELGCGAGHSTKLILDLMKAQKVIAVDLDAQAIKRARKNLVKYGAQAEFHVGDLTRLDFKDASFDAVVDFAALHHVPDWQQGILEIKRLLKPGGLFLFEEVTRKWIQGFFPNLFFVHPRENRFNGIKFKTELEKQGFYFNKALVEKETGNFIFGAALLKK